MTQDVITLNRITKLHPELQGEALIIYNELFDAGIKVRFTCTLRGWEEQAALYARGRTTPGPVVTWALAGESFHNYGLALDFVILNDDGKASWDIDERWMTVVNAFEAHGWQWGGRWKHKDNPHVQKTFGLTITKCMELSKRATVLDFPIPIS